jgi:predicted nucleic acid-binding protein
MSDLAVIDTSIWVDRLRAAEHEERWNALTVRLRNSAVVLAELWRGAQTTRERNLVAQIERNHPVLVPTLQHWTESGRLLRQMKQDLGFEVPKLRNLHFDVLIALSARSVGARLITSNRRDFELINRYCKIKLEIW